MQQDGHRIFGFDILFSGNIPRAAGLSSSASIEIVTADALNTVFSLGYEMLDLVKLAQKSENRFCGVNCGIMDQFAVGMGKAGHAILLDCATLDYRYVPLNLPGAELVITNTNKPRGLADSKYNERRAQCEAALTDLKTVCHIQNLCDLTPPAFEKHAHVIKSPVARSRATHAVFENARTLQAVDALTNGDLAAFGQLMNASHVSLRDLYEVTGPELDALAEAAWECEGVLGSRMTGAGFGGCTVSIVRTDAVAAFKERVGESYTNRTGLTADFYIAETGNGAGELEEI
jgi:galactokinase